ncbi:MAG: hypothetical protein AB8B78_11090 [Polaribacter sp.]
MVVFLLPIAINSLHDFLNHEHTVCDSKIEKHVHEKDLDCTLHLLKQNDSFLDYYQTKNKITEISSSVIFAQYNFLKNHYKLSFSLRGPPAFS